LPAGKGLFTKKGNFIFFERKTSPTEEKGTERASICCAGKPHSTAGKSKRRESCHFLLLKQNYAGNIHPSQKGRKLLLFGGKEEKKKPYSVHVLRKGQYSAAITGKKGDRKEKDNAPIQIDRKKGVE